MDQAPGPARFHTHFYDVAGADHNGVASAHGALPAPMTSQELREHPALLRARHMGGTSPMRADLTMPTWTVGALCVVAVACTLITSLVFGSPLGPALLGTALLLAVVVVPLAGLWALEGFAAARRVRRRSLIRSRLGDEQQIEQRRAHVRDHGALPDVLIAGKDQILAQPEDPAVLQRLDRTSADLMNTSPHLPVLAVLVSADVPLTLRQVQDRAVRGLTITPRKAVRHTLEQMVQTRWVLTDRDSKPHTYRANRDRPGFAQMLQLLSLDTDSAALRPQDRAPQTPAPTAGQDPQLLARAQSVDLHELRDRMFFEAAFAQQIPLFGLHEQENARQLAETVAAVEQLAATAAQATPAAELTATLQQLRSQLRMAGPAPSLGSHRTILFQALTAEHNAQAIETAIEQIRSGDPHDIAAALCTDALARHAHALRQLRARIDQQPDMPPLLDQLATT